MAAAIVAGVVLPLTGSVCLSVGAAVAGWVLVVRSRARRVELERVLARHLESSLDLVCTASFDGFFTRLNPAWTDVLGWELDELMARPFRDFIHPDDVDKTAEVVREIVAGVPVVNFQNRYRCRDGGYRWLEWTARADQRVEDLYAVARDITARKEAEAVLASFHEALERAVQERTAELEERTAELEERTGELDESRRETLRRLALAAEYRDDETFEHTERVGRMSADLARELDISAEQVELLRWAAPLHDVGKLGLSDTIVLKPGKLTSEEMEQVKHHPGIGARILANSNSDVLQLAEQIALNHHEWWDGSGYPNGLAGEEIPLCARIVAIADVYDALTHERPYKRAWPAREASEEIRELRGQQFDPRVVDAFFAIDCPELQRQREAWTHQDADQTAADMDQTQADSHQTASDANQLASDSDQALADREQHASDRDQAAADSQLPHDPGARLARVLERSRLERDAATVKRDAATVKRDAATVKRDAATVERDVATVERDAASRERDSTAAARSRTTAERIATADLRDEVARRRDLTATDRDRNAQARDDAQAERDPAAEALERHAAEDDREAAAADRQHAAADRSYASLDELTGVFRRGAGELALTHEIDRARRSGRSLVLAVIDVDALKALNDSQGHAAGDALLRDLPEAITSTLRSYDVTVRWGGDEFVCGLSDVTLEAASDRIAEIQLALNGRQPRATISAGLAELNNDDTLETLIARADRDLYRIKNNRLVPVTMVTGAEST